MDSGYGVWILAFWIVHGYGSYAGRRQEVKLYSYLIEGNLSYLRSSQRARGHFNKHRSPKQSIRDKTPTRSHVECMKLERTDQSPGEGYPQNTIAN
jgi:hypothetical protein